MLRVSSGTTRAASNSKRVPRPLQSSHMPWGELKEKAWGVSSGKEIRQCEQAALSVKVRSRLPSVTIRVPAPTRRAVSTESVTRALRPERTTMRSITASTVCFRLLSRLSSSSLSTISPSTRRRIHPARRASVRSSRNSPLRLTRSGASRVRRLPFAPERISRAICSALWPATRSPHWWQCWMPTRAYRTLR